MSQPPRPAPNCPPSNSTSPPLDAAASRFSTAGTAIHEHQTASTGDPAPLNHALRAAEEALLNPEGLPRRDWYKHTIYAPGEFTGYAAVVIPGVNEGIDATDKARTQTQIESLTAALSAAHRFAAAGIAIHSIQNNPPSNPTALNQSLRAAEEALLNPDGLPRRSWFKHTIYAPGEFTGYAAVVIPGVNEAIDASDAPRAQAQLAALAQALNRSAAILDAAAK